MRNRTLDDELGEVRLLRLSFLLWHSRCPQWHAHLVHRAADVRHQRWSECDVAEVGYVEYDTQPRLDTSHVVGGKLTNLVAHFVLVHIQLADEVRQFTRVDLHRARCRAEPIRGTGLVAIVFVLFPESGGTLWILASRLKVTDFALNSDAHTGRQCQSARHTVDLAETALDAFIGTLHLFDGLLGRREVWIHQVVTAVGHFVEVVVEHRQWLQALDEAFRVVIEDHTLVQQSVGVEDGLQLLHGLVGLVAPFVLHEGSHVAASAVLCLQRTIVFLDHEFGHIAHHLCIAVHLTLALEALVEYEVVVALEGMTIDTSVAVTVIGDKLLQLHRCLRQTLYREGHILNETRRAYGACTADRREDTRADSPVFAIHLRVFGKFCGDIEAELP